MILLAVAHANAVTRVGATSCATKVSRGNFEAWRMQHSKTADSDVAALSPAGLECELRDAVIGCRENLKIVCSVAVFARGDCVAFAGSADSCR